MKSKYFAPLMLLVMVLFTTAIQPVEASPAPDLDTTIEVADADNSAVQAPVLTSIMDYQLSDTGSQYTAMEVCNSSFHYDGLIDHQIIIVQAPENSVLQEQAGYTPYRARSNIGQLSIYA
ncbi:hypothetical protein LX73_2320 [Fodinibius salinus]|uniref:Uncharacterized protein n=1 Tax=Fodinibius salinus TaxID=860790 RepID=A0A5D3YGD9_9BACT|nr:hypothetical protein [Fodinibius salinus]TYP92073.1 hypothetical protein LX73_2320 [Fodinibius salinus]